MERADRVERAIQRIMKMVQDFTLDELMDLRFDLEERIKYLRNEQTVFPLFAQQPRQAQQEQKQKQEQERKPSITVREEWKQCGKLNCKCAAGELHGPYVYEYWREGERVKSRYLGRAMK